jgi:glycosyltransferase involved in cell wall biosynthesis
VSERRVMILCYFFPPLAGGGVHRVLSFVRHLPAAGWKVTVVCAGEEDYWVKDATLDSDLPSGTEVIRVRGGSALAAWLRGPGAGEARGRRRASRFSALRTLSDWFLVPDSYAGWARRAADAAHRRLAQGGIDALVTSSPPDSVHLAGRSLARTSRIPWIADFRDPWIALHFRRPPSPIHHARHQALERAVVAESSMVLAASRTHAHDLTGLKRPGGAPLARRVEWLPNGFEPDSDRARATAPAEGTFALVFTGTLAGMPGTAVFLDALAQWIARRPDVRARVRAVLAGPYEAEDEERAHTLGVSDLVAFPGPLAHRDARALQRRADLLLLWKPEGDGYRTMVPGKLYEYLDAGRPLLALIPDGEEAARLATDSGAERIDPADHRALSAALERRFDAWAAHGPAADRRPEWIAAHERAAIARRLAGLLEQVTEPRA